MRNIIAEGHVCQYSNEIISALPWLFVKSHVIPRALYLGLIATITCLTDSPRRSVHLRNESRQQMLPPNVKGKKNIAQHIALFWLASCRLDAAWSRNRSALYCARVIPLLSNSSGYVGPPWLRGHSFFMLWSILCISDFHLILLVDGNCNVKVAARSRNSAGQSCTQAKLCKANMHITPPEDIGGSCQHHNFHVYGEVVLPQCLVIRWRALYRRATLHCHSLRKGTCSAIIRLA